MSKSKRFNRNDEHVAQLIDIGIRGNGSLARIANLVTTNTECAITALEYPSIVDRKLRGVTIRQMIEQKFPNLRQ